MNPIDLLRNLMIAALVDDELAESELALLENRRQAWGVSAELFAQVLSEVEGGDRELTIPESLAHRHDLLAELVIMVAADGRLHKKEKKLLQSSTKQLGLKRADLQRLIDEFVDDESDLVI
ncbi:MAG: TerB family tellurite resistance protein [Pirellulaceae bacterium]|nr:TerB family tellurite resistance protein [Pirellulaceae bacterium]MDP7016275.1 TerB family tellurite resistance protein [Pirellulaceae bacterium]